ncbi:MAG TPA: four helix bundle protein [Steroidobacteraceae bacterium]|nr:four helix bundle protein [Steroidobacteraceae bacterium]
MATEPRNDHRDLLLWRKALDLTVDIHKTTKSMPRQELFGLVSQLRRASVSIPSNIAEGTARRTTKEFIHFLHIARGSLAELDTQLLLARRFGYLTEAETTNLESQVHEVGRLLNAVLAGLRRRLRRSSSALSPIP